MVDGDALAARIAVEGGVGLQRRPGERLLHAERRQSGHREEPARQADARPDHVEIAGRGEVVRADGGRLRRVGPGQWSRSVRIAKRPEEHTSELQSLMRISYAVFCLKNKIHKVIATYQAAVKR